MARGYNKRNNRKYRRGVKKVKKTWALAKKGAKSQASQIITLQKQINRINRMVMRNTQWSQYAYKPGTSVHTGGTLAPVPFRMMLVSPSGITGSQTGWTRVFNSNQDTDQNLKWQGRSLGIEYCIELGNAAISASPITITTFIVSLRKEIAQQVIQETNYLQGDQLVENEHYSTNSMGSVQGSGMCFLNKSMFKIHHCSRATIGAHTNFSDETHTTTIKDNRMRRYVALPYKCLLKGDGSGVSASWLSLNFETIQQTDQRFFLVFANNYGGQTLDISLNCIFTGRTTQ